MTERDPGDRAQEERTDIIETVKTPLGFFTLVVLVVEIILGISANLSQGTDRTNLIVGMLGLIFLLVIVVAGFALIRPEALRGERPARPVQLIPTDNTSNVIGPISDDRSEYQVHKYSGTWKVVTSFSRWRGRPLEPPNSVTFRGRALLLIRSNGQNGVGVQFGELEVFIDTYYATFDIVNEVLSAFVDQAGILTLKVRSNVRKLKDEEPKPKEDLIGLYAGLRGDLKNPEWDVILHPHADMPLVLKGGHVHDKTPGQRDQLAEETYDHLGLFPTRL